MNATLNRRTFLKASGVSLALPLMEAMNPAWAREINQPPKRMVLICDTNGLHAPALFPKKAGADYELTDYLKLLKEHRKDLTLFSGLSHPDQFTIDHQGEKAWLSGAPRPAVPGFRNSISVDQHAVTKLGYVTRFPSVSLSSDGPISQSFTSNGVMIPAEYRPSRMFAKLFLQGKPEEIRRQKQKLAEGRSILDELMSQTKSLLKRTTAADRARLEEYLDSVRTAEKNLAIEQALIDQPKPKVQQPQPDDIEDKTDLINRIKLLLNLVPLIIQTDSSRVISIVIQVLDGVPQVADVKGGFHNLSHHGRNPAKINQLKKVEGAIVTCFAELLSQLKAKKEAGGTLLDNTMTLLGSSLGNANAHTPYNLPILLAGGGFRHGSYVAHDANNNTPLCNLFVRMLGNMGLGNDPFSSSTGELNW